MADTMSTRSEQPQSEQQIAFHFASGRVSIDFANTGGSRDGDDFEDLREPEDLTRWLAESGLRVRIPVTSDDLELARTLRNALWRVARSRIDAGDSTPGALDPSDIDQINACAARPSLAPRFDIESGHQHWLLPATALAALSTIARDAIDLLSSPLSSRIRECASPDCILFFVDTSRPGKRRWCSMDRCGNISKTRGYRRRRSDRDST